MAADLASDARSPGGGSRGYGSVLSVPGMRGLYAVGMLARIPHTGGAIALLLLVTEGLGRGYAAAGLVTAALTVGIAVGSPWRGRLVDRLGLRRALVPSIVAMPVLWTTATVVPYPVLVPVAFVSGLLAVPVFTVVRQAISLLLPPADRRAGYALDSVLVEVSFLVGPPSVILVVTAVGPRPALTAVGLGAALAGLLLFWLDPLARVPRPPVTDQDPEPDPGHDPDQDSKPERDPAPLGRRDPRRRPGAPPASTAWVTPGVLTMYATAFGAAFVLAGSEVGVLAAMRESDRMALAAALLVVWGAASAVGGLAFGAWRGRVPPPLALLGLLAATTVPLAAATGPLALALLLLPAGALVAPTLSSSADGLSRRTPESVRGEAMGWHGSATTAGFSLGAPVAGLLADLAGPWLSFLGVAAVAGLVAAAASALVVLRPTDQWRLPARSASPRGRRPAGRG